MRLLVRHQWVREHGTPRITTLVGPREASRRLWSEWVRLAPRPGAARPLFEQPARGDARWLDRVAAKAAALATTTPRAPVAIAVEAPILDAWLAARTDRLRALVGEGLVIVPPAARPRRRAARAVDGPARSLAELTLFEALEATPSTAGRFQLNQSVSFHFGSRAAEIDLLSRQDELAIEVDGHHHFTDRDGYRRARRKDVLLQAHGYVVLRVLAEDVLADPREAVRMVIELLAGRRRR